MSKYSGNPDTSPAETGLTQLMSDARVSEASESERDMPHAKRMRLEPQSRFEQLSNLISWREKGLIDSPEFKHVKRDLVGMPEG